jgi:hypothetical protein
VAIDLQHLWGVGEVATAANFNNFIGPPSPRVDIDVFATSPSHVNWDTLTADASGVYGFVKASTAAVNNEINWDIVLGQGTWTFELMSQKTTTYGIATVQLSVDGSAFTNVGSAPYNGSASTIDTYNASLIHNVRDRITGITIGTTGIYRLKLLMATKNASSTNFTGAIQHAAFWRTA